jgi:hypothetical protein
MRPKETRYSDLYFAGVICFPYGRKALFVYPTSGAGMSGFDGRGALNMRRQIRKGNYLGEAQSRLR